MRLKLTDQFLKSLKPPAEGRLVISDTERSGLRFRMTANGRGTFLLEKKIKGGKRHAFTIGSYPGVSLAQARAEALRIEIEAQAGIDRIEVAQREAEARAEEALAARSVGEILDLYIASHIERNLKPGLSREERKRHLRNSLSPYLALRMDRLSRAHLQTIVDAKAAEGKVVMGNRLRASLCAFTRWAYLRGHTEVDAGDRVQKAGRETARARNPSLAEVRHIWAASYSCGDLWGPFFRLCILTGQRSRDEILNMRWAWVDFDAARLALPTTKNRAPHIVHLSAPVIAELKAIRDRQAKIGLKTPFVFTTTGLRPASGVSRAKMKLDATIAAIRAVAGLEAMEHWTLHDLRRSQATALAEAGFAEGVVDRIQNHVAVGSKPSIVAAIYTLASLLPERARALDYWAQVVLGTAIQGAAVA